MHGRLLMLMTALGSTIACSNQPEVLIDTSGAKFGWECRKGSCELEVLPETPEPLPCGNPELVPTYSYVWGRFIEIHSVCGYPSGSWSGQPWGGRIVTCDETDDCPQLDFFATPSHYECRAGLCQNVDTDTYPPEWVTSTMAETLCVADRARDDWPGPELDALIAQACGPESGDPCTLPLPEPCWQPL